jgi:hypothetical protein
MDAMAKVCRDRFEAFGTAGNARKIKVIPMSEMAKRYASGANSTRALRCSKRPEVPCCEKHAPRPGKESIMNIDAKTEISGKERYKAGVLKYAQMGYWDGDYVPKDTDIARPVPHYAAGRC